MLKNKKMLALTSAVILRPMLAGLVRWNRLPENIPGHWNIAGEVDPDDELFTVERKG